MTVGGVAVMAIKTQTKSKLKVLWLALALVAAAFLIAPNGEAAAPDGLYSAKLKVPDSNGSTTEVYMQIRVDNTNNEVVLGAGTYGNVSHNPQASSCLRTDFGEPTNESDQMYKDYSGVFDINARYALFKASTTKIYDTSGNTVTYTFPGAITQIGHGAFKDWGHPAHSTNLTYLTNVIVPNSVTEIGSDAFHSSSVKSVDFSQATNLVSINSSTFNSCKSLTSVDLSNTKITRLETSVFQSCEALTSVQLPNSLTRIENTVFYDTHNLTHLTIPPNVNYIENTAFEDHSVSPRTKILKFTGNFDKSFNTMANASNTYVKLLYPAGNPTWENSAEVQALVAAGKAASYIAFAPTSHVSVLVPEKTTPTVLSAPGQRITSNNAVFLVNIAIGEFSGVWIDGSAISPDTYTARAVGENTEITFKPWFVRSLAYGRHTIAFITIYNDIAGSYFFRG